MINQNNTPQRCFFQHNDAALQHKINYSTKPHISAKISPPLGGFLMKCTVRWAGQDAGMSFVAETASGHAFVMDGAPDAVKPENGGQNLAPRPMETLLAGTGGCTAYDVVLILKRGRHDVRGCSVKLSSQRAEVDPKVFTHINMHFTVTGKGVPALAVERAIAMSHDKYCSASIMLGKTAEITTSFEVVEAD